MRQYTTSCLGLYVSPTKERILSQQVLVGGQYQDKDGNSVPADCNDPIQYMFSSDSDGSEVSKVRLGTMAANPRKPWLRCCSLKE